MKKKLTLADIKVQSFVTALDSRESKTVNGGHNTDNPVCNTGVPACRNSEANVCNPFYTIGILPDTTQPLAPGGGDGGPLCL